MNKQLKEKRDKLIKETPSLKEVIRGSLMKYYPTCGNPRCRCRKEGGHGVKGYLKCASQGHLIVHSR